MRSIFQGLHARALKSTLRKNSEWKAAYEFCLQNHKDLLARKKAGDEDLKDCSVTGDMDKMAWYETKREYPLETNQAEAVYYRERTGEERFVQFDGTITRRKYVPGSKEDKLSRDDIDRGVKGEMTFDAAAMDKLPARVADFGTDGGLVSGEALEWPDEPARTLRQDVDFAAEYAMRADMKAYKCPSGRAWFMVVYARQYPKEFASNMLSRFIPSQSRVTAEEELRLDNATTQTMLEEMFKQANESETLDNEVAAREDFAPVYDEIVP